MPAFHPGSTLFVGEDTIPAMQNTRKDENIKQKKKKKKALH
jgi:hypothetical protein